jgi:hypothetical protein
MTEGDSNMRAKYTGEDRYWHQDSERYTGGDSLATALLNGWIIYEALYQEYSLSGGRHVIVHQLKLSYNNEISEMLVIDNPFVNRLIFQSVYQSTPVA